MVIGYSRVVVYFLTIHLAILLHLETITLAQPELIYHVCSESGNYTMNSRYKANLDALLPSLIANKTPDYFAFYNNSVGESTDKVYSLAFCRGDILPEECYTCVNASAYKLREVCPNQMEAIAWYDHCMFRYSNRSIMGTLSPATTVLASSENVSDSDMAGFNKELGALLDRLQTEASSGNSLRKFGIGDQSFSNFERVYVLLQCSPDLSLLQCSNCIDDSVRIMLKYDGNQRVRVVGPSCDLRYALTQFFVYNDNHQPPPPPEPQPQPPPPPPPPSLFPPRPTPTKGKKSNTTKIVIIVVIPTVTLVTLIVCISIFIRKKEKPGDKVDNVSDIKTVESLQFDFGTIRVATDNFSDTNKIGQGGFGAVYKGTLSNGQDVAVKRLCMDSGQGDHAFKNEVLLVAKLEHRNLVRLEGFCLEGSERILVYEFLPNASLDHFIFDPANRAKLNWESRYKIIGGISRGLLYLHEDSQLRIIHRDLKASNILLDAEMRPKIADFGMARLFVVDQTHGNTSRIVGTYGYMAPEYMMHGHFSVKSDVFSFGVLVLEIVSGQMNSCFRDGQNVGDLLSHAWKMWKKGTVQNLIDPTLSGSSSEIMQCIHIGLLCVQENVAARPSMYSIVLMLNSHSTTLPMPSEPSFLTESGIEPQMTSLMEHTPGGVSESDQLQSKPTATSLNGASITELEPR